jgi:hypothetical protein
VPTYERLANVLIMNTSAASSYWLIALASLLAGGLLLVSTSGCGDGSSGPVADSVMVQALMEMHLLRARAIYRETENIPDSLRALQDSAIIRRGISPKDFRRMLDVYVEEPERYQDVYTAVVDSLNSLRVRLSEVSRDSIVLDSLLRNPQDNAYSSAR